MSSSTQVAEARRTAHLLGFVVITVDLDLPGFDKFMRSIRHADYAWNSEFARHNRSV